jgi:hypothetical protein
MKKLLLLSYEDLNNYNVDSKEDILFFRLYDFDKKQYFCSENLRFMDFITDPIYYKNFQNNLYYITDNDFLFLIELVKKNEIKNYSKKQFMKKYLEEWLI